MSPADPQETQDNLSIGKAAKLLGVSIDTLRRWSKKGKIKSYRSPGGHRYFLKEDLKNAKNQKYTRERDKGIKAVIKTRKARESKEAVFLSYKHEILRQLLPAIKILLIAIIIILLVNFLIIDIVVLKSFFR